MLTENAQILKGPGDITVSVGDAVTFNCSVSCSSSGAVPVSWYLTLPAFKRNVAISPYTSLTQMKSFYRLDLKRSAIDDWPSGARTVQLSITNVAAELNAMPVQCGALLVQSDCSCSDPQLYYSKFSILKMKACRQLLFIIMMCLILYNTAS